MPDPKVTIIISAKDAATGALRSVSSSLSGITASLRAVNSVARIARSLFVGGMFAGVIFGADSLARRSLDADVALRKLAAASDLAADKASAALAPVITLVANATADAVRQWSDGFIALGKLIGLLAGAGAIYKTLAEDILKGTYSQDTWTRASQNALAAIKQWAPEVNEASMAAKGIADVYRKNLPAAADEVTNFKGRLSDFAANHKVAMAKIKRDWDDAFADAEEKATEAWSEAAKDIAKIEKELAKNIAKERGSLSDKLADIDKAESKSRSDLAKEATSIAEDKSKELYRIEKDRIKSLADLDSSTGKRIREAETEHVRDAILEERAERIGEINQEAAEKRAAVEEDKRRRQEDLAERRAETATEFEERRSQAREETEERIKEMREEAAERKAERAADRDDQIRAVQDALAKQLAAINERKIEEEAAYAKQVADETSAHNKRLKNLLDTRTEQQKLNDAAEALAGRWEPAIQQALRYRGILQSIGAEGMIPPPGGPYSPNFFGRGYQGGGDFIVPPGFPNDTFPMRVSSGEHVSVTNNKESRSIGTVNIYVQSNDPQGVRDEVQKYLEEQAWIG